MRIIALRTLRDYWETHRDVEGQLRAWYDRAKRAKWQSPAEVKQHYPTASIVPGHRVVFNITRSYRLVVKIQYDVGIIYVRFIGTHSEYDRIDVTQI